MYQLDFDSEYSTNIAINATSSATVTSCEQYSATHLDRAFTQRSSSCSSQSNLMDVPAAQGLTKTLDQKGSLSELRMGRINVINPSLVLPLLASAANDERWLLWLSERAAGKPAKSEETRVAELPVIHMNIHSKSQWLLTLRAVNSGNHHVCVEWQGVLTADQRESLREAAEQAGSHLFVICRDQ